MPINLGIGVSELCRMQGFDAVHDSGLLTNAVSRIAVLTRRVDAAGMTVTYTDIGGPSSSTRDWCVAAPSF